MTKNRFSTDRTIMIKIRKALRHTQQTNQRLWTGARDAITTRYCNFNIPLCILHHLAFTTHRGLGAQVFHTPNKHFLYFHQQQHIFDKEKKKRRGGDTPDRVICFEEEVAVAYNLVPAF